MKRKHPVPVQKAMKKIGSDLRSARKRRLIKVATMADRMGVSEPTLRKIENGDPSVQFGHVAQALFVLQMLDRLADLASLANDELGQMLEEEDLPQRIRN
jgi:transcriptional regulator with XRE-family HTH domain